MSRPPPALRRILLYFAGLAIAVAAAAAEPSPPAAQPTPASPADLERLIATLEDDGQRAVLVKQLQTLLAAEKSAAAQQAPSPATILDQVRERIENFAAELADAATVVVDIPSVIAWGEGQINDPAARLRWLDVGRHVALIVGAAVLADIALSLALAEPRRRLRGRRPAGWAGRIGLMALEILLDALPVGAFAATASLIMPLVQPHFATRAVVTELVAAMLAGRLALVVARALLLVPSQAAWALLPLSEETANYLYIWARRFVIWGVYAWGIVAATWWVGIPGAVFATLQKGVALVATLLAIVFVLQNRHAVAEWIRPPPTPAIAGPPDEDAGEMPTETAPVPPPRHPAIRFLRHRLAEIWHVLAVVYLAGMFCVYALRIADGFSYLFRATALTVILFIAARVAVRLIATLAARGFAVPADMRERFPTLEPRANRYLPLLTGLCSAIVWAFALLAILEVWGIRSFAWLGSELGRRAAGSAVSVGVTILIAFGVWEVTNATFERYLAGLEPGVGRARGARLRTLLPLLRNALWFTLLVIVSLLVLTELDVNIVPLLAGASVIGLAIGIGSQALVKDVITGLFILIEDTIAVGDVVDLGPPHAGVVEAISVRTVRLRDTAGAVHTLPFSEISKVTNLGRDYAFWLIDFAVPYSTDPDRVIEVYRSVVAAVRADPAFAPLILGDIEPWGLTAFNATTIQVQARVKTLPLQQWKVGREISRRLRPALEAAGVPLPNQVQTVGFDREAAGLIEKLAFRAP